MAVTGSFLDDAAQYVPTGNTPVQNLRGTVNDFVNAATNAKLQYCNLDGITLAQKLKYQLEFKALDTDGSGYLSQDDLQMSTTQIQSMINTYLKQQGSQKMHIQNYNYYTGPGGGGPGGKAGCCYGRSLSEITSSALKYLQDLGFLPKQAQDIIDAALVKKVLQSLQSDKTKISECQFATAMFYAEKLDSKYQVELPKQRIKVVKG